MKKHNPLVTIIVVTMNNLNLLRNCLNSLHAQDYEPIEIIVVDNGSDEDIQGMLLRDFPDFLGVRLDRNYGFAEGNNRGIERAQGKYIALINNDAVATPQWISSMVSAVESDDKVGAVASIIIDGNKPDVLDSFGVGIALDGMSRQAMRGRPVPQIMNPEEVLVFSGCACLLRKEALDEVGDFDKDFFAYCEDTDLGLRLRWAGWKIVVAPNAYVQHFYSMTVGKFSLQKIYFVERNHVWVAIKNFPWFLLFMLPFVTAWRYIAQTYFILSGKSELNKFTENHSSISLFAIYLKSYISMLLKSPVMFTKRLSFRNRRRISSKDMLHMLLKYRLSMSELLGY